MRVLLVGATGIIGREIDEALRHLGHEVLEVTRHSKPFSVDLREPDSIRALYRALGRVDAVVSAAGEAKFAPLAELTDADFELSLRYKLMGQVNLVRLGFDHVADGGSFTLTSGILNRMPMPGGAAYSVVNGGLDAFVKAAALEAPRGVRVNVVSPPWIAETLRAMGRPTDDGLPAAVVARAYVQSITGTQTGAVIEPVP
jgi:NAD(P)-dependent dehydrogenase (short-subunit alcohol dehydrogenase family)